MVMFAEPLQPALSAEVVKVIGKNAAAPTLKARVPEGVQLVPVWVVE